MTEQTKFDIQDLIYKIRYIVSYKDCMHSVMQYILIVLTSTALSE